MEDMHSKFDRGKSMIEKKGVKINMGMTNGTVSDEGCERVISRRDPCRVRYKRVTGNSALHIERLKWAHKRCSAVKCVLNKSMARPNARGGSMVWFTWSLESRGFCAPTG